MSVPLEEYLEYQEDEPEFPPLSQIVMPGFSHTTVLRCEVCHDAIEGTPCFSGDGRICHHGCLGQYQDEYLPLEELGAGGQRNLTNLFESLGRTREARETALPFMLAMKLCKAACERLSDCEQTLIETEDALNHSKIECIRWESSLMTRWLPLNGMVVVKDSGGEQGFPYPYIVYDDVYEPRRIIKIDVGRDICEDNLQFESIYGFGCNVTVEKGGLTYSKVFTYSEHGAIYEVREDDCMLYDGVLVIVLRVMKPTTRCFRLPRPEPEPLRTPRTSAATPDNSGWIDAGNTEGAPHGLA